MDVDKLQTLGIPVTDAYNALQTFLGGLYVNDFNRFSHTWQVLVQAEPEFRSRPSDIDRFYVRGAQGNMVPLGTLASVQAEHGAGCRDSLQSLPRGADSGRPAARRQLRRSHRRDGESGGANAAHRLRLRVDRHYVSAEARAGTRGGHLRIRHGARVSVPGGAVRKLVDPVRGAALAAAGAVRRAAGGLSAPLSLRHLHADRNRDADRTGGQERDSDRRVRQGQPHRASTCRFGKRRCMPRGSGCARF